MEMLLKFLSVSVTVTQTNDVLSGVASTRLSVWLAGSLWPTGWNEDAKDIARPRGGGEIFITR